MTLQILTDPVTGDQMVDVLATISPELLNQKVLNHGYVKVLDCMPRLVPADTKTCDFALADAARMSYQKGTRKVSSDAGLIDHLIRNQHCYTPDMKVLTPDGWRTWESLASREYVEVAVPNPVTHAFTFEKLKLLRFFAEDQTVHTFKNSRSSFTVTGEHRVWFKRKVQRKGGTIKSGEYALFPASSHPSWGWFEASSAYSLHKDISAPDPVGQFCGFYLGDGGWVSKNTVSFHLRKPRKRAYLRELAARLGLSLREKPSGTYPDAVVFYITAPAWLRELVNPAGKYSSKAHTPELLRRVTRDAAFAAGVMDGLTNSDGSRSSGRKQICYSSSSTALIELFEYTGALLGMDCRRRRAQGGVQGTAAYIGTEHDIEVRQHYWSTSQYTGNVFCVTSSTGLLLVRREDGECAIVCGNSSPVEMGEIKYGLRMPLFVIQQHNRHRQANLNQESARYSVIEDDFYVPEPQHWAVNTNKDKQATEQVAVDPRVAGILHNYITKHCDEAYALYKKLMDIKSCDNDDGVIIDVPGIAREQARMVLSQNIFSRMVWKQDLRNHLHYLNLRMDHHAQFEIREYADAMARVVEKLFPATWASFKDHVIDGVSFSKTELGVLKMFLSTDVQGTNAMKKLGWTARRMGEFLGKCEKKAGFYFKIEEC